MDALNKQLIESSARPAWPKWHGVLHNVGKRAQRVNVSATVVSENLKEIQGLQPVAASPACSLGTRADLGGFLDHRSQRPAAARLSDQLAGTWPTSRPQCAQRVELLRKNSNTSRHRGHAAKLRPCLRRTEQVNIADGSKTRST